MARLNRVIREITKEIDAALFIGGDVPLKKCGRHFAAPCPFHEETTASFHVFPDDGTFKCYGCGAGGDVISYVMKRDNASFLDAVRTLAVNAGIILDEDDVSLIRRRERDAIYKANALAAAYFERVLQSEAGAASRAYCQRRGFSPAIVQAFHLGYAPDSWNGLVDELRASGVDLTIAAKAGLVIQNQRGGYYDFYRNRLIVPTYATTGEVLAFGGRVLGNEEPKYLNTGTTPVYTKGAHLFALDIARHAAQTSRAIIMVEGYLDCIALHEVGFTNTVAALGTAFTEKQAAELRKYADVVFLCYDADDAGLNAAKKSAQVAGASGLQVRIVSLEPGEDPDSFVRAHGTDAFRALLDSAQLGLP